MMGNKIDTRACKHFFFKLDLYWGKAFILSNEEEADNFAKNHFIEKISTENFVKEFVGCWNYKDDLYKIYLFTVSPIVNHHDIYIATKS